VAFGHRRHVSNLVAAGATAGRVRLTGGGARSGFWSQMLADVLGMPIEVPDAEETGARGAAVAAGVAIDAYRDIDQAMDRTTRVARAYLPNPEHAAIYGWRFEMYAQLVDAMAPFWRRINTAPNDPGA
jgi:L-xylulokinase